MPAVAGWREGALFIVEFRRPEKRNALTREMWLELARLLTGACRDPGVRVVMLRGAGGLVQRRRRYRRDAGPPGPH